MLGSHRDSLSFNFGVSSMIQFKWNDRVFALLFLAFAILAPNEDAGAQTPPSLDRPMTRLRPLGAPSAVDQFRQTSSSRSAGSSESVRSETSASVSQSIRETSYQHRNAKGQVVRAVGSTTDAQPLVRQTVLWQDPSGASPGGMALPSFPANPNPGAANPGVGNPGMGVPNPGSGTVVPGGLGAAPSTSPRSLPSPPVGIPPSSTIVSPSDLTPVPVPQLGGGFANVANCHLVSPASSYSAASGIGCGCGTVIPTTYTAPPVTVPNAAVMPPVAAPLSQFQGGLLTPGTTGAPAPSLLSLGQQNYQVQVGQGLWGQPKAYVPGQGIRNWIRYFFP